MKYYLIKGSLILASIILLLSICALDSDGNIQYITCIVSLLYISLVLYANGYLTSETKIRGEI